MELSEYLLTQIFTNLNERQILKLKETKNFMLVNIYKKLQREK